MPKIAYLVSDWWVAFTTPNGQRVRQSSRTTDERQAHEYLDRLKVRSWEAQRLGVKPERSWQEAACGG
jgi:hypothetical protein